MVSVIRGLGGDRDSVWCIFSNFLSNMHGNGVTGTRNSFGKKSPLGVGVAELELYKDGFYYLLSWLIA